MPRFSLSKNKRQVALLYVSTLLGTLVGMLVSILNTRSLNPVDYGDVRYVNNFISFFAGIFLFGYFWSGSRLLAISKTKEEGNRIKGAMTLILAITGAMMMVVLLLGGIIHQTVLSKCWAHLFYLAIPFCSWSLCLNYINTSSQGDNSIKTIAAARLLPSLIYLLVGIGVYSLFGATSELMMLLQGGIYFVVLVSLVACGKPSFVSIRQSLHKLNEENKRYGLQVYYGALANVTVPYIAGITLGAFSSDNSVVGFYNLALTITMPLQMLPNIIGTTYFKQFANQRCIAHKVLTSTYAMTVGSLILYILLIQPLVNLLYSQAYATVAVYASFLAIGAVLQGLSDVYNRFLGAHAQGIQLRNSAFASGFVSLVGYTLGVWLWGVQGAIVTRLLSALVQFVFMKIYYKRYISQS